MGQREDGCIGRLWPRIMAEKARLSISTFQPFNPTRSSDLLNPLYPDLLYRRLPDFLRHPFRSALGALHLDSRAQEDVDLLGSFLPQPYICKSPGGRLQGGLPGRLSRKYANLFAIDVSERKISLVGYKSSLLGIIYWQPIVISYNINLTEKSITKQPFRNRTA